MKTSPTYVLFEIICGELAERSPIIFAHDDLDSDLLEELKNEVGETDAVIAFEKAVKMLLKEFKRKATNAPFSFDKTTSEFSVLDFDYIDFVDTVSSNRGVGGCAADFEREITERLRKRLTGAIHRVGHPRRRLKKRASYSNYLIKLGFAPNALGQNDKDGGFDVLWLPPLGVSPLRPVICLHCKNTSFNEDDGNTSVGRADRTISRHSIVNAHKMHFVVFNDYIDESFQDKSRGMSFIPLGLTDLGTPVNSLDVDVL